MVRLGEFWVDPYCLVEVGDCEVDLAFIEADASAIVINPGAGPAADHGGQVVEGVLEGNHGVNLGPAGSAFGLGHQPEPGAVGSRDDVSAGLLPVGAVDHLTADLQNGAVFRDHAAADPGVGRLGMDGRGKHDCKKADRRRSSPHRFSSLRAWASLQFRRRYSKRPATTSRGTCWLEAQSGTA